MITEIILPKLKLFWIFITFIPGRKEKTSHFTTEFYQHFKNTGYAYSANVKILQESMFIPVPVCKLNKEIKDHPVLWQDINCILLVGFSG